MRKVNVIVAERQPRSRVRHHTQPHRRHCVHQRSAHPFTDLMPQPHRLIRRKLFLSLAELGEQGHTPTSPIKQIIGQMNLLVAARGRAASEPRQGIAVHAAEGAVLR